jgi:MoaE-MoaD fusion protein
MQIRVLFFGMAKEMAGTASQWIELPEKSTVQQLVDYYRGQIPKFAEFVGYCATSVNQQYAGNETRLQPGDEVAFLPPVSGGADQISGAVQIVREKIDAQAWVEKLKRPADGAAIVFEGVVRDNSRGHRTLYLDYEAYEPMAERQMRALVEDARQRFPIRNAAIIHRLGRLEIGETSVLIIVASAHRVAAFDACRWLIDTLKRTVPIWKKEYFEDGAVWADGEAFPAELKAGVAAGSHPERTASK